mmetsp:Transcript_9259/g.56381  ORF Transcript_9259/g.56381 Transcript_9259/m.56381 type:complete len:94 (+) Transcript_9259:1474-1755(+)
MTTAGMACFFYLGSMIRVVRLGYHAMSGVTTRGFAKPLRVYRARVQVSSPNCIESTVLYSCFILVYRALKRLSEASFSWKRVERHGRQWSMQP